VIEKDNLLRGCITEGGAFKGYRIRREQTRRLLSMGSVLGAYVVCIGGKCMTAYCRWNRENERNLFGAEILYGSGQWACIKEKTIRRKAGLAGSCCYRRYSGESHTQPGALIVAAASAILSAGP
jgi:hypothetical protein